MKRSHWILGLALLACGSVATAQDSPGGQPDGTGQQPPGGTGQQPDGTGQQPDGTGQQPPQGPWVPGSGQKPGDTGRQLRVGERAPDLRLPDLEGKERSLEEYAGNKVLVIEWIEAKALLAPANPDQPSPYEEFKGRPEVTYLTVCTFGGEAQAQEGAPGAAPSKADGTFDPAQPDPSEGGQGGQDDGTTPPNGTGEDRTDGAQGQDGGQDGAGSMTKEQVREKLRAKTTTTPILLDEGGRAAKQFGVSRFPHLVIIDAEWKVAFSGPAAGGDFDRALDEAIGGQGKDDQTTPDQGGMDDQGTTPDQGGSDDQGTTPDQGGMDDQGTTPDQGGSDDQGTTPDQGGSDDQGTTPDQGGSTDDPIVPDSRDER